MNYKQAVSYLESFIDYERRALPAAKNPFRLDRVRKLLFYLDNPHEKFKSVHVAGTNGKGSTSAMIASILGASGLRTGLYTSPHLVTFRERISINGELVGEPEICALVPRIREAADSLAAEDSRPSFFEVYTALCFLHFAQVKVDFAVVEVGLGGRLDATNVISPEISVITPVSIDHVRELGGSIGSIAAEKCGIIKPRTPVVTGVQKAEVLKIIAGRAEELNAPLTEVKFAAGPARPRHETVRAVVESCSASGSVFSLETRDENYSTLFIPLLGAHQAENAALAAAACGKLGIGPGPIREGLAKTRISARVQFVPGKIPLLIDGGHNPQAAEALGAAIKTFFSDYKITLIFGASSDKDFRSAAKHIFPLADRIILTRADNPRAADPALLREALLPENPDAGTAPGLAEALETAFSESGKNTLVCVAGSFFLAGEAIAYLEKNRPARRTGKKQRSLKCMI